MNVLLILILSISTSLITSFLMMKFHMKMIEKWMDRFFREEEQHMKDFIRSEHELEESKNKINTLEQTIIGLQDQINFKVDKDEIMSEIKLNERMGC